MLTWNIVDVVFNISDAYTNSMSNTGKVLKSSDDLKQKYHNWVINLRYANNRF